MRELNVAIHENRQGHLIATVFGEGINVTTAEDAAKTIDEEVTLMDTVPVVVNDLAWNAYVAVGALDEDTEGDQQTFKRFIESIAVCAFMAGRKHPK